MLNKFVILRLALIIFLFQTSLIAVNNKVLILHSYHQTFEWTREINKGLFSVLNSNGLYLDISIEYLDEKRHQSKLIFDISANLFREKYKNEKLDVIISSDNIALDFLNVYKNELFPGVPLIFCGVNDYDDSLTNNIDKFTGITEHSDVISTLKLALRLYEKTTDVAIISDTTKTSQRVIDYFFKHKNFPNDLKYHIYLNKSNSELVNEISQLPDSKVILQLGYFINDIGFLDSYTERLQGLSKSFNKPIFGVWGIYLGKGIIGGKLTSPFKQGEAAAILTQDILRGEKIENISIKSDLGNYWGFDDVILKKYNIDKSLLPQGSSIINAPDSSVRIDKDIIWTIIIILVLLVVIIVVLSLYVVAKKKAERALIIAKENAEKTDKLKSEFLAQISHEIRTPVNVILSFISILKEEFALHTSDDVKDIFGFVKRGAERLTRTIDLLINVSELRSGVIETNKKVTDLNKEIIEPIYNEYKVLAEKGGLKLSLELNHDINKIFVDSHMIKQVVINLVDNAIKYSEEGEIKLVSSVDQDQKIFFYVEDQGIGMTKEYIENIFNYFSQEDQGYTRKYEGNGLGLSLSKKYCELNSADILVKSEKGKGSKFSVVFN